MQFDANNLKSEREFWSVFSLNGEPVGCVLKADTEEGWVEQILTNRYRGVLGMPEVSEEEEKIPVRRYGVVRFEGYCDEGPITPGASDS